jgi:vacuolar protein sorting-associated protein 13A/C
MNNLMLPVLSLCIVQVNQVQLDNQLAERLYPVIAAPVPPTKSVLAESVPKPFLELAVLLNE